MHFSIDSSMYSAARSEAVRAYEPFIYACASSVKASNEPASGYECSFLFTVISSEPLSSTAQSALIASAEKLGYGPHGCFFVMLQNGEQKLHDQGIFTLLEGIDARALVITDKAAGANVAEAYQPAIPAPLQLDSFQRILGRDTVVFSSFEKLLETPLDKQRAWALLKELKRD